MTGMGSPEQVQQTARMDTREDAPDTKEANARADAPANARTSASATNKIAGMSRRSFVAGIGASAAPAGGEEAPTKRTVLAFASDQHGETPGFEAWLRDQLKVYGDDLVHLTYGGDICDKSWEPAVFEGFKAVLDELVPGRYSVTTGNQEHKTGAPGPDWDSLGPGFLRTGEAASGEDYLIYHLGAAQETMEFPVDDIARLSEYLEYTPRDIPVFVVSHYPLHLAVPYSAHDIPGGYRQAKNNEILTQVLNKHPNVIFLWGHNHTFQDPRYGTIRPAGSKFTWDINDPTQKLTVNFTYANMGSFCRGDTYGAVAEITREGENRVVKLYFVDTDVPMDTKESAVITFSPDGAVVCDTTASDSINFIDMFYLSGWYEDPDFMADY